MTSKQRIVVGLCVWAFAASVFCMFLWRAQYLTQQNRIKDKQRIAALDARNQAVHALIDSSGYGVAVLDENGKVMEWNPALEAWTGYRAVEMLGRSVQDLMDSAAGERHSRSYGEVITGERNDNHVKVVKCHLHPVDGPPIPVNIRVYVVRSVDEPYAIALIDRVSQIKEVTQ